MVSPEQFNRTESVLSASSSFGELPTCIELAIGNTNTAPTVQTLNLVPDTVTENGAPAFTSTTSSLLDFFSQSVRGATEQNIVSLFTKAYNEDAKLALAILANLRDARDGKGERDVVRHALLYLRKNNFIVYIMNLPYFIELGYYKDLLNIVKELTKRGEIGIDEVPIELKLMAEYLNKDHGSLSDDKVNLSLVGKWAPTLGTHYDSKVNGRQANKLSKLLFPESKTAQKDYRKLLVALREQLKVVEKLMAENRWSEINFGAVPSKAHRNLRKAFGKHEEERYKSYLDSLKKGEAKINVAGIQPHELVQHYYKSIWGQQQKYDQVIESQWETMVFKLQEKGVLEKSMAIVDVSGSMQGLPMMVAMALGMITSQLTSPPFTNTCITFSAEPEIHNITGNTLQERVKSLTGMKWGYNTDLLKVFKLILSRAKSNKLAREKMIKTLFLFTDMQFDVAQPGGSWKTTYGEIKQLYNDEGYDMPQLVFWNLRAAKPAFPCTKDTPGVALVSGYSAELLKVFMDGGSFTPMEIMMKAIQPYVENIRLPNL